MPQKKTLIIAGAALFVLILIVAVILLSRGPRQQSQAVMPEIFPTATLEFVPTQTPVVVTQDPNTFYGDWYFVKLDEKQQDGLLKGNDIGWFKSATNPDDVIHAVCSAPRSPSPKSGDLFRWDPTTNKLYPVNDNAQGNIQRFWYPSR